MKYLVTGGAGFIGSHLVDFLIKLNHEVSKIPKLNADNELLKSNNQTLLEKNEINNDEISKLNVDFHSV
jgi:nucleoside-diphosphate-sugar epimerase